MVQLENRLHQKILADKGFLKTIPQCRFMG